MAEVLLICRFVPRTGVEFQLRALLQSMLAPTHAEPGCKRYELYESDSRGASICARHGKVKVPSINIWQRPTFKRLEQAGGELVREPFEINIVKGILTGTAAE